MTAPAARPGGRLRRARRRPFDSVGVVDIDNQFQAGPHDGRPGSESTGCRTGKIVHGRAPADLPIADRRGSHDVFDIHSDHHSGNQVIRTWDVTGGVPLGPPPRSHPR